MNVIVHLPSNDTGKLELSRKIAEIHADRVEKFIHENGYSENEKRTLIAHVIEAVKHEKEN